MEDGTKVWVKGEVEWGENFYEVNTEGVILDWDESERYALVTLGFIDGDYNICLSVEKDIIKKI